MAHSPNISVEFRDVSLRVNRRNLLNQLSITIHQGECLVLLGRSGSGKTTTLKLINNLLKPTSGEVLVDGKSTTRWNEIELRRSIGYVIQETGLFPHFNVKQNVGLVPSLQRRTKAQIESRVNEMLNLVGLEADLFAQRYPHQLSGGQRQRVGVARALAADPPIVLMDEPFGALDPITRLELQQQFRSLQRNLGKTVILVTHDIHEAFYIGNRIGLMHEGKLVTLGTKDEFMRSAHPEALAFMACLQNSE